MSVDDFLVNREPAYWSPPLDFPSSLTPMALFAQNAPNGLEVVVVSAVRRPTAVDLRNAWSKRRSKRATPVLLVALYATNEGNRASLCGPVGELAAVRHGVEVSVAERIADAALDEPSHHAATRLLHTYLPELDHGMPGLRNVGLLATHQLRNGVPTRPDWVDACRRARSLLIQRGRRLAEGLGFTVRTLGTRTSLLTTAGEPRAVAVFCRDDESFDTASGRFEGASPVSRALADAAEHQVDWVILTRAASIRLHSTRSDFGVGRRGRAEHVRGVEPRSTAR